MHGADLGDLTEFLKTVVPLIVAVLAYLRGSKALRKARAVEAACTYPACGHVCPQAITP